MAETRESIQRFGDALEALGEYLRKNRMRREAQELSRGFFQDVQTQGPSKTISIAGGRPATLPTAGPMVNQPNFQNIRSALSSSNEDTRNAAMQAVQTIIMMQQAQDPTGIKKFTEQEETRTRLNIEEAEKKAKIPKLPNPLEELLKRNIESLIESRKKTDEVTPSQADAKKEREEGRREKLGTTIQKLKEDAGKLESELEDLNNGLVGGKVFNPKNQQDANIVAGRRQSILGRLRTYYDRIIELENELSGKGSKSGKSNDPLEIL